MACETVHITVCRVTVFCTQSTTEVTNPTLVHTLLYGQVEHGFFFTIVDTCNTGIIRLTVVSTNLFNHVYRQVLQTGLNIATKEFLTIDHQFLDFLTIDLHVTVIVYFGTRQLLYQFFQHSTFRSTVSRCIVTQCIARNGYLRSFCGNYRFLQHDSICSQCNLTHVQSWLGTRQLILFHIVEVTYIRYLQHILTRTNIQAEVTVRVCHITHSHGAVRQRQELNGSLHNRRIVLLIHYCSANSNTPSAL